MKNKKQKVVVAMSGGVDSSLTAALLKRAGFDCLGVYMRLFKPSKTGISAGEKKAKEVAKVLGIPFKAVDFEKGFKKNVMDYFLAEYKAGRTPNPCVVCNKEIKFGLLMDFAIKNKFDYLATGHYARVWREILNPKSEILKLLKARNENKDQSYFLWRLGQKELKKIIFPIGDFESKEQVRKLAKEFGLPNFNAPESNDVCFLQDTNVYEFLDTRIHTNKKGKIVDVNGKVLGEHKGLWHYTIGQRKGLGFSGGPYFVVAKDIKKNKIIVSKNEKDLLKKELVACEVNWISGIEPKLPLKAQVKIRYRAELATVVIQDKISKGKYRIIFEKPQKAITSGQSAVFYLPFRSSKGAKEGGDELLGGGIIEN